MGVKMNERIIPVEFVSAKELSRMLGISRTTVFELVKRKQLPMPVKFGKCARWNVANAKRALGI